MLEFMFEQGKQIEEKLKDYDLLEELEDLIVAIYGLKKTTFNQENFEHVVSILKNNCDYSMMNTNLACLYASLLIVLYDNPTPKIFEMIEAIDMVRNAGFRSRVSNMIGLALLENENIESQVFKALKIYHIMHDYHGVITGEDDYLSTIYLAELDKSSKAIIEQIEEDYRYLGSLSFNKGNALQSLVHQIQLIDDEDRIGVLDSINDLNVKFKANKIKTNGSQIFIFGLIVGLQIDVDEYIVKLNTTMTQQLEKKNLKRLRSLHMTSLMLQLIHDIYREKNMSAAIITSKTAFIKASLMLMLTAYLYRERLI